MASSKFILRADALLGGLTERLKAETEQTVNARIKRNLNMEKGVKLV